MTMFNWYGFMIGVAIVAGYLLINQQAKKLHLEPAIFDKLMLTALVGGVLGARLWHVMTDWQLYLHNLGDILKFTNGGLSIFGAILGGSLAVWLVQRKYFPQLNIKQLLDLMVFGLPVGQAIGRLGNYFNQELYGLPTDLPWGIPIEASKRAGGYEQFTHFQPLFAYEAILVLLGWLGLNWLKKKGRWQLGEGKFFKWYVIYYLIVRFLLDFIRIQKGVLWYGLGINQLIILVSLLTLFFSSIKNNLSRLILLLVILITGWWWQQTILSPSLLSIPDRSVVEYVVSDKTLQLEVVNTPQSISLGLGGREEVGSDGMLFVFAEPQQPVFWMKGMLFPIDILWLSEGKIVGIERNIQPPILGTVDNDLERYPAPQLVDMVLETAPGYFALQ